MINNQCAQNLACFVLCLRIQDSFHICVAEEENSHIIAKHGVRSDREEPPEKEDLPEGSEL